VAVGTLAVALATAFGLAAIFFAIWNDGEPEDI
jgi:hypothetical protein